MTPGLLSPQTVAEAIRDCPKIDIGGLFLPQLASYGPAFARLLEDLEGPEVRRIVGEKLNFDLTGRPTMVIPRCNCQATDRRIDADSKFKSATLLLYVNHDRADTNGGKLRILAQKAA